MTRTLTRAVAIAAALALPATGLGAGSTQEGTKTLYLSVLDESGKPVKDMTADELVMREDGKDIQIVSVGPAQAPLHVVVLVDTSDSAVRLTQDIRTAIGVFIKHLHTVRQDAAIELMEFGQAPVPATHFTTDETVLLGALNKMVGKPTANAVLLEALVQANKDLDKQPGARRAVVSLNVEPSNELSLNPNPVRDAFRKTSAQLWSLSLQAQGIAIGAAAERAAGVNQGGRDASASAGRTSAAANAGNLTTTRNAILQDFAKATGGTREMINAPSAMADLLKGWADALTYQYEVVYKSANKNAKVVLVGTTRQGVHLHASGFPPQGPQ
jgi:VWFA-related protein